MVRQQPQAFTIFLLFLMERRIWLWVLFITIQYYIDNKIILSCFIYAFYLIIFILFYYQKPNYQIYTIILRGRRKEAYAFQAQIENIINNQGMQLSKAEKQQNAALKIQKLWRSYTNRKIYKYYRDIIMFKCKGNPAKLLKGINPLEAQLLETAVNCHVRFRLGGDSFPPNIYYKVFSKTNVCDINSFAPRDYSSLPRDLTPDQKIKMSEYQKNRREYENQGWYLRNDNNGWRPISHKMFIKADYVQLYSAKKVHFYHHKKQMRNQKYVKKQRIARLKWIKNLYKKTNEKEAEKLIENIENAEQKNQGNQYARKLMEEDGLYREEMFATQTAQKIKQIDVDSQQFDKQMEDLVEWTENLDFESYVKDWYQLSTSQSSSEFVPKFVNSDYNILL